jgi:hypothetical protein
LGLKDEPFDPTAFLDGIHDLMNIGERDSPIEIVVGLDRDRWTRAAEIEATR